MEENKDLYKIACYTSENKQTGRIIEVALWNRNTFSNEPVVAISFNDAVVVLDIKDIPELILSLNSIIEEISLIKSK